ncbi:MAG: hypothetical protein AB1752_10845 [Candidatus Zixiibacteriota bacterium]
MIDRISSVLCRRLVSAAPISLAWTLCLLVLPGPASAQIVQGAGSAVSQRAVYLSWDMAGDTTDASVFQWFVPVIVRAGLADNWELSMATSAAGSEVTWIAEGEGITGANDTRIQLSHSLSDDQVLLSGGVSIPTGETELSETHQQIINWLTADFFNFPSKYPGEGFAAFGEAAFATPAGEWVLGGAGAVHYAGEYTPFADGRTYQPGMRLIGSLGIQRDWLKQGALSADLVLTVSTDDKAEGVPVFADGMQVDAKVTGRKMFRSGAIDAVVRVILRGKNKLLGNNNADLVREAANTNGSDIRLFLSGSRKLGRVLSGWASVETKILAANDYAPDEVLYEGAAQIMGFGAGLDYRLGERAQIGAGGKIWTGSTDGGYTYEALDLSGYELTQRLTVTF